MPPYPQMTMPQHCGQQIDGMLTAMREAGEAIDHARDIQRWVVEQLLEMKPPDPLGRP